MAGEDSRPSAAKFAAATLYPIGFLAVILGRAQLFTENTLYPVVVALAFVVGLGAFDHSIASAAEALSTTLNGAEGVGGFVAWLVAVTLGNIVGGVVIVSLLNYGQVRAETE